MKERLRKVFGCDLRSLAVFRIALALLVLYDVADRFPHAEAFYSDSGFFSTAYAKEESPQSYSLNYLSGDVQYQQALFVTLGIAATALAAGFYTRLSTFVCWILVVSVHVRNPFVLIGGDTLLRMLLFWSLFIPLGQRWSLDHWIAGRRKQSSGSAQSSSANVLATMGTACLIFQVCIMYWCAGIAKMTDPWFEGTAMEYILRLDLYVRPFGEWALTQPWLLKSINYGTLVVELVFPFLLLLPFWTDRFRLFAIASFLALHIGIELSLDVGNFGMVSIVSWIPLVPGCVWTCCCCSKNLDGKAGQSDPIAIGSSNHGNAIAKQNWLARVLFTVVPLFFLIYILVWNYGGLYVLHGGRFQYEMPKSLQRIGWSTMVAQNFQMFGDPPRYNPTYVFSGRTAKATDIDLIQNQPAKLSRPDSKTSNIVSPQWKKLHRFLLRHPGNQKFHSALLEYYTAAWNKNHAEDDQVLESRLECYYELIGPEYQAGDFVRRPDLATWKATAEKLEEEKTDEELIDDVDSFFKGLEQGPIIPMENR